MLRIPTKVWSHLNPADNEKKYISDILESEPKEISSFRDLVKQIAEISYHNPEYVLFFRGQLRDYKKNLRNKGQASSFYPSIYRMAGKTLSEIELIKRFKRLDDFSEKLLAKFAAQKIEGHEKISKFRELVWAILQHYEVCDTPLLDVTHSLRVAASFALNENKDDGYLFVFGFPHPNGSITYSVEAELINIRLLSICPPEAHRPYFQEGFLVGSFPSNRTTKHPSLDVGRRLIAKYRLKTNGFWDSDFHAIPNEALYPNQDLVKDICAELKSAT
jgi:hypothetical protein